MEAPIILAVIAGCFLHGLSALEFLVCTIILVVLSNSIMAWS